jgi:hypothetical protein
LKAFPVPLPAQAPDAHPAQLAQRAPLGHCESLVHQHGTPAAVHLALGDATLSQLPIEQDHVFATDVAVSQSSLSFGPLPVHEPVHVSPTLTHLPLEQSESSTHKHAVPPELSTGAGVRVVTHAVPPLPTHATELGGGSQLCSSAVPDPVQLDPHAVLLPPSPDTGTHLPLSH